MGCGGLVVVLIGAVAIAVLALYAGWRLAGVLDASVDD